MNLKSTMLTTAACLVALACGREATTASGRRAGTVSIPVTAAVGAQPVDEVPVATASALASATASARAPSGAACIEVDTDQGGTHVALEGRVLVDGEFEHPTRGKTRPYVLRLDAPRCAKGIDDAFVTEVALASSEGAPLKPLVGRRVRVAGDPFMAHTAWHARPIVLMTTTATRIP